MPEIGNLLLYLELALFIILALATYIAISDNKFIKLIFGLNNTSNTSNNINSKLFIYLPKFILYTWILLFILLLISAFCFLYAHIVSDFSVLNVALNSNTTKPLIYKIAGSWGSHEGSMFMWILALLLITIIFLMINRKIINTKIILATLLHQNIFVIFFLTFIIYTCNPFVRLFPTPLNGLGFNPILQDIGLVMHPPSLYFGYVGFSIIYSITAGFLYTESSSKISSLKNYELYLLVLKPFVFLNWSVLTIGITLGSWWAYRELGWGGFWFWDPVENAALMPWIIATILVHITTKIIYQNKIIINLTILFSLLSFIFAIIGMFLVRSGIITSVHSFASDSKRGIWLFGLLLYLIIYGIKLLFKFELKNMLNTINTTNTKFILNIILLQIALISTILFTVSLGTLYPILFNTFTNQIITIGAQYFNSIIGPITLITGILCIYYTYNIVSKFKSHHSSFIYKNQYTVIFILIIITLILLLYKDIKIYYDTYYNIFFTILKYIGIIIGVTLIILTIKLCFYKHKITLKTLPMIMGHIAFGLFILSISMVSLKNYEKQKTISIGESIAFLDYKITFKNIYPINRKNHIAYVADMVLYKKCNIFFKFINKLNTKYNNDNNQNYCEKIHLYPEMRIYTTEKQLTYETDIYSDITDNLYIHISNPDNDIDNYNNEANESNKANKIEIITKIYYKPYINILWLSALIASIAGFIAFIRELKYFNANLYKIL